MKAGVYKYRSAFLVYGGAVVSLFVHRFIAATAAAAEPGSFLQTGEEAPKTSPLNRVGQPQTTVAVELCGFAVCSRVIPTGV